MNKTLTNMIDWAHEIETCCCGVAATGCFNSWVIWFSDSSSKA